MNNKNSQINFQNSKNQEIIFISAENKNLHFKNKFKPYFPQVQKKSKTFDLRVSVWTAQGNFSTIGHHNMHHFHNVCILTVIIVCSPHEKFY